MKPSDKPTIKDMEKKTQQIAEALNRSVAQAV